MMEFMSDIGLELDMTRKFHRPIWAAVGSARVLATFVMGMGVGVVFVSGEGVDAFDAETLHLVNGAFGASFGCSFGFVHIGKDFGEEAAENIFTFGVGGIGGGRDESYGVEG